MTFTKTIMKKLKDQCRKVKYLHQVKLQNYVGYGGEVGGAMFFVPHSNCFLAAFAMNI